MENISTKQYYYAIISGVCACWASLCGKLSGNFSGELTFHNAAQLSMKAVFIFMMLTSNAAVWTYYVKALQSSKTTITPTVVSTASNYILSAVGGFLVFKESITLLWSCGMFLVVAGLTLIVQADSDDTKQKSDKKNF